MHYLYIMNTHYITNMYEQYVRIYKTLNDTNVNDTSVIPIIRVLHVEFKIESII